MPDLAIGDLTYTPQAEGGRVVHRVSAREKRVLVQVTFGDGALTYPSGGIPLTTTVSDVDMQRAIRRWELVDSDDASGIVWKYDHTNKKLRGYRQGIRTGSTAAAAAGTATNVEDMALAETAFEAAGVAIDTDIDLGILRELTAAGNPPAAQTLFMYAYGW